MKNEFVLRGQTASGETELLEFGGYKEGYAYRLIEFQLFNSSNIGTTEPEMCGTITAGKTAIAPTDPNFNDEGLIATAVFKDHSNAAYSLRSSSVINDTFLITQNLILMVQDTSAAGTPVNWQCRFISVKLTDSQQAVINYKQFSIFDE